MAPCKSARASDTSCKIPAEVGNLDPTTRLLLDKAGLTARQRQCLELWNQGFSYRRIADAIGVLDHSTVYGHVQKALRKVARALDE